MDWGKLMAICVMAVFVNNYVLSRFLGLCPFIGVSKRTVEEDWTHARVWLKRELSQGRHR